MKRNLSISDSGVIFMLGICAATLLQTLVVMTAGNVAPYGNLGVGQWLAYVLGEGAFLMVVFLYLRLRKTDALAVTKIAKPFRLVQLTLLPLIAVATIITFLPLSNMFIRLLGFIGFSGAVTMPDFSNLGVYFLSLLLMALLPAVGEEFFIRGSVYNGLAQRSLWFGICVSALLFSLMHANPLQTVYQFGLGAVLALVFVLSGSLVPCIVLHFLNNFISLTVTAYLPQINAIDFGNMSFVYNWFIAIGGAVVLILLLYWYYRLGKRGGYKAVSTYEGDGFGLKVYASEDGKLKGNAFTDAFVFLASLFKKSGWRQMNNTLSDLNGIERLGKQPVERELTVWFAIGIAAVAWLYTFIVGCVG